jgi:hypothetical protein
MPEKSDEACPICGIRCSADITDFENQASYRCPRCGHVQIGKTARAELQRVQLSKPDWYNDALSHSVRQLSEQRGTVALTVDLLTTLQDARLRPLIEQANNLILWVGCHADDPAEFWPRSPEVWASIVGGRSTDDAMAFLLRYCDRMGWIELKTAVHGLGDGNLYVRLDFEGWSRLEQLQREQVKSRVGFMARQFNIAEITNAYEQCFKKAAEDAGFGLRILTEAQGAGLIDDQLRVAIRTAKFLIADVSSGNRGAYWEAGFAEGLGRSTLVERT